MIDPPSFISVNAFCTVNNVPFTLRSKSFSKCSSVRLANGANSPMPALATRTSIFPVAFTVAPNANDIIAEGLHGVVELLLTAARYKGSVWKR
jgi:hypothetical protein